jgi:hypothetical protein
MKNIKHFLKILFDGSLPYILYKLPEYMQNLKDFKRADFANIEAYYQKNKKQGIPERNVLVEGFMHLITENYYMALNLIFGHAYATNTIALITDWSRFDLKYLFKKYNILKTVCIFSWKNIYYRAKAIISYVKNLKNLSWSEDYGWHIFVDSIDIGDLIYDDFLRVVNLPTYRILDIKFRLFIISGLFRYFRYKDILTKYNITDIFITHPVYRIGILIRVAASLNRNITIWQRSGCECITISKAVATSGYIRKIRIYEPELMETIIGKYGKENLLNEYIIKMNERMNPVGDRNIDTTFVYKNNEINTVQGFINQYQKHRDGKNIFVFSHCFVDAVRLYETLYCDYYTWLYETLVFLAEKSHIHNIYVKPHPSEKMYKCSITVKSVVDEINRLYNADFIYLDKKIHNKVVFDLADTVLTAVGTIALEATPFGIPVLAGGKADYAKAKFVIQPETIKEYKAFLNTVEDLPEPSPEAIERAKLCFVLSEKYFGAPASFLAPFDWGLFMEDKRYNFQKLYTEFNEYYKTEVPLDNEPLYKMFLYMIEHDYHDTINFCIEN